MPPRKNQRGSYLQVYPGLNDFSDALESIPETVIGHLENLKEIEARSVTESKDVCSVIGEYFKTRNTANLNSVSELLDKFNEVLENKVNTALLAAQQVSRQVQRLDIDFGIIKEHEIPEAIQFNVNDPAFVPIVPPEKQATARTQARREAREAREARRTNHQIIESRSGTPVNEAPAPTGRRRGRLPAAARQAAVAAQQQFEQQQQHEQQLEQQQQIEQQQIEQQELEQQRLEEQQHEQLEQQQREQHEQQHEQHELQNLELEQRENTSEQNVGLSQADQLHPEEAKPQYKDSQAENASSASFLPAERTNEAFKDHHSNTASNEDTPLGEENTTSSNKDSFNETDTLIKSENSTHGNNETKHGQENMQSRELSGSGMVLPPVVMPIPTEMEEMKGSDQTSDNATSGLKRKRGNAPKSTSEPVYCYCQQGSFGEMVGCDGSNCEREWFHLDCIGLSALPTGQWFCEECRAKNKRR